MVVNLFQKVKILFSLSVMYSGYYK